MTARKYRRLWLNAVAVAVSAVVAWTCVQVYSARRRGAATHALILAVIRRDTGAVNAALADGADPDARLAPVDYLDLKQPSVFDIFRDAQSEPGDPPLLLAFEDPYPESGAVLFRFTVNKAARSRIGATATALIYGGADINAVGVLDMAPLDFARAMGLRDVVSMLVARHARSALAGSPAPASANRGPAGWPNAVVAPGPTQAARQALVAKMLHWRGLWAKWAHVHRSLSSRMTTEKGDSDAMLAVWRALPVKPTAAVTGLDQKDFAGVVPAPDWRPALLARALEAMKRPASVKEAKSSAGTTATATAAKQPATIAEQRAAKAAEARAAKRRAAWMFKAATDMLLSGDYQRLRDVGVFYVKPADKYYTMWASGRITEDNHRGFWSDDADERELAPPIP
jgi:hypothetical protein